MLLDHLDDPIHDDVDRLDINQVPISVEHLVSGSHQPTDQVMNTYQELNVLLLRIRGIQIARQNLQPGNLCIQL